MQQKITYTSTNVDLEAFHRAFDAALAAARAAAGREHALLIGGEEVRVPGREPLVGRSPIDTRVVLGRYAAGGPAQVDAAMRAARAGQRVWARTPWRDRLTVMRRAAALIRERKFDLAATMCLEVGKNRLEAMGDAEESADLIEYYAQQVEDHGGFVRDMARLTPIERNTEVLRPYGVFLVIAPFNFPLALSTGMTSAALVSGNAVVYKPAQAAPWTGVKLAEVYRDAGLPPGVFNLITGQGADIGDALWRHPEVDGVAFTGSKAVGMRIFHGLSERWVRPCLMELGGKNATLVMDSADLDAAAEGVMRSSFGLQGQKCSATSRVYVHAAVADAFMEKLVARSRTLRAGDPCEREVYLGPVIDGRAVQRYEAASEQARREGAVVLGGERLRGGVFEHGHFVAPTIAEVPLTSTLLREELFLPFLSVGRVRGLGEAIAESNKAEYGLTAGLFSRDAAEIERFFDEVEAGVCYVNKRSGATTGAWPGAQPFCGWKGSGSSGKGGCGPWYVQQFMREQSRTVITEVR